MNFILYMVFGVLEIFALFALMLKTFRFPYFSYIKEITVIAVVVTFLSYLIRVYFDIFQVYDILLHMILYILFFRYIFKIKYWRAIIISFTYYGYIVLVILVFMFYTSTNIVTKEVLEEPNGISAYIIQFTSATIVFLVSYIIHKMNTGFSFISVPPHDFMVKNRLKKHDLIVIFSVLIIAIIVFLTLFFIFRSANYISVPLLILSYAVLVYLAYRRDMTL
ncbi:hypothetical protein AV654_17910 [Paenibacillus elgii]|uniref:Uncharacterized protein n=1 Tax=Paenibacillus elgii TaxID=189691 RepID=A0A161SEN6_9BACL|nr:hypothetical protein AV654_17910 [Paenibacillus elgii]